MRERNHLYTLVSGLVVLLTCALIATSASAGTILIDFNDNFVPVGNWNVFHTGNDGTTQPLIWDDGTASGISLALPTFNDSANPGWNPANPLPSWAPTSVANDYSFFNAFFDGNSGTAQFVLSGLDPTHTYALDIIVSRNLNRDQDFTITHGGGVEFYDNWNSQSDGWVAGNVLTFAGLTPDLANEIVMDIQRESTSGAFNAIRITSMPEPGTFVMTALGIAGIAAFRRHRA
jgi:hypothetical protein